MKLNLKKKLASFTIIAVGSVFTIFLVVSLVFIRRSFIESNEHLLLEETQKAANAINQQLSTHMGVARGLAQSFEATYFNDWKTMDGLFNASLKRVAEEETDYLAVWSCFQYEYILPDWGNKPGRVSSTWSREGGELNHEDIIRDVDGISSSVYYDIVESQSETIVEPYWYQYGDAESEKILETTISIPMQHNGIGVGVVGIDMSLDAFPAYVANIKPFDESEAYLLSAKGAIIGHVDEDRLGKPITDYFPSIKTEEFSNIQESIAIREKEDGMNMVFTMAPIYAGKSKTPWFVLTKTPQKVLYAKANWIVVIMLSIGLIAIVLIALLVYVVTSKITKPIVQSAQITSFISSGRPNQFFCLQKRK